MTVTYLLRGVGGRVSCEILQKMVKALIIVCHAHSKNDNAMVNGVNIRMTHSPERYSRHCYQFISFVYYQ